MLPLIVLPLIVLPLIVLPLKTPAIRPLENKHDFSFPAALLLSYLYAFLLWDVMSIVCHVGALHHCWVSAPSIGVSMLRACQVTNRLVSAGLRVLKTSTKQKRDRDCQDKFDHDKGLKSAISGRRLHWRLSTGFFAFSPIFYVQFSKTSPSKSGESNEKSSGENRVKSCRVCGCHGFFGPEIVILNRVLDRDWTLNRSGPLSLGLKVKQVSATQQGQLNRTSPIAM